MNTHKSHDALQGTPSPSNLMNNFYDLVSSEESSSLTSDLLDHSIPNKHTEGKCTKTHDVISQNMPFLYPQKISKELFIDKYEVLPVILGSGSFGCVQECKNKKTGEIFAVKCIEKKNFSVNHLHCIIQREIEALREVNHSGVIKMIDCFDDYEYFYIVMEICSGGNLHSRVAEQGHLSEEEANQIVKQLLEAVKYLHSRDIVHRDIKPENIMFKSHNGANDDGVVKLVDLGMATKHKLGTTPMISSAGTPVFMSPEVFMNRYDRSCDLWSVGVTTYFMLCGYRPFNGSTRNDIMKSILSGHLDFSGPNWRNVSLTAKSFISCLLKLDPQTRYTAEQALEHPWINPVSFHKLALLEQAPMPSNGYMSDFAYWSVKFKDIHTKIPPKKARMIFESKYAPTGFKLAYLAQLVQVPKTAIRQRGDSRHPIYSTKLNKHQSKSPQKIVIMK